MSSLHLQKWYFHYANQFYKKIHKQREVATLKLQRYACNFIEHLQAETCFETEFFDISVAQL